MLGSLTAAEPPTGVQHVSKQESLENLLLLTFELSLGQALALRFGSSDYTYAM